MELPALTHVLLYAVPLLDIQTAVCRGAVHLLHFTHAEAPAVIPQVYFPRDWVTAVVRLWTVIVRLSLAHRQGALDPVVLAAPLRMVLAIQGALAAILRRVTVAL